MTDFDRTAVRRFRFTRCTLDAGTGAVALGYAFDDGPEMVETVQVPGAPFTLAPARAQAVQRALRLLHLVAGVSYYKAAVPPELVIEGEGIDAATAALLTSIYENGLGEFAYRNGLSLRGHIHFPVASTPVGGTSVPIALHQKASGLKSLPQVESLPQGALVAIGGGKDSLVSIEALRALGVPQT
nr:endonuclease domain-containing protein [Arenimonas sp.]